MSGPGVWKDRMKMRNIQEITVAGLVSCRAVLHNVDGTVVSGFVTAGSPAQICCDLAGDRERADLKKFFLTVLGIFSYVILFYYH